MRVKICGINSSDALDAALGGGADDVGFVFFDKSPRYLPLDGFRVLSQAAKGRARRVGLFVDQTPDQLAGFIQQDLFDMLQLHGDESLATLVKLRQRFGIPICKAVFVGGEVPDVGRWTNHVDALIFDAKRKKGDTRPGGLGRALDWNLLKAVEFDKPWCLAGGLNCDNVVQAAGESGAEWVDVSSGVEISAGVKSPKLIEKFIKVAKSI